MGTTYVHEVSRNLGVRVSAGVHFFSNFCSGKRGDVSTKKFNNWLTRYRRAESASRQKLVGVNRGEMGRKTPLETTRGVGDVVARWLASSAISDETK